MCLAYKNTLTIKTKKQQLGSEGSFTTFKHLEHYLLNQLQHYFHSYLVNYAYIIIEVNLLDKI